MSLIKPPLLSKGDTIGIMAPGSYIDPDELKIGCFLLEANGYNIHIHSQTYERHNQSAGTSEEKAKAFHDLLLDDQVNGIFFAGGGNRSLHFLKHLDLNIVIHNPKVMMGYSDCTALLSAIYAQTGIVTFHGPTATWFARKEITEKDKQVNFTLDLIGGKQTRFPLANAKIIKPGKAQGNLWGGNLSLVMRLLDTKWCPDLDNVLLFIEDIGDELSWLDRDFWYLRERGILKNLAGLVLGDFTQGDTGLKPFGFSLKDILVEHLDGIDIPVVMNAPFGHHATLYTLPIGIHGTLDASDAASAHIEFDTPVGA